MPPEIPRDELPEFVVSHCIDEALSPGIVVEVDAELAEDLGAFEEDAVSLEDAVEANVELVEHARG